MFDALGDTPGRCGLFDEVLATVLLFLFPLSRIPLFLNSISHFPISGDEIVSRAVVTENRMGWIFQFRNDPLSQSFAELDAPLIKRVDVPDNALGKDTVLIERDEGTQDFGSEFLGQNGIGRPVPLEDPVRHQPVGRCFGLNLGRRFAKGQGFRLGEDVGQEHVVVAPERRQGARKSDKIAGDQPSALVD